MPFSESRCKIQTVYCGNSKKLPSSNEEKDQVYKRKGTPYECLKKGFGGGIQSMKKYPANSLLKIKFLKEKDEKLFKKEGISNLSQLLAKVKKMTPKQISSLLKKCLTSNKKAYNMTLLYIFRKSIISLPSCLNIALE